MKVLILMTSARELRLLDGTRHTSGYWAEEFVVPYERLVSEGYDVDIATVGGEPPTVDRTSIDPMKIRYTRPAGSEDRDAENAAHFREVIDSVPMLEKPLPVEQIDPPQLEEYDGIYLAGGHGAMEDMPRSWELALLLALANERGMTIAAVCHGHAGLISLRNQQGRWPFEGYRMTAFSHEEEMVTDMVGRLPFVLQFELQRLGAKYEKADEIWGSHVVVDRNLITGQNPYSSAAIADTFVKALSA